MHCLVNGSTQQIITPAPVGNQSWPTFMRWLLAFSLSCFAWTSSYADTGSADNAVAAVAVAMESVNINTADAAAIADTLVGIGLRRAEAIVAYRNANGNFQDPYELVAVKGVGEATIANNEERIRLRD